MDISKVKFNNITNSYMTNKVKYQSTEIKKVDTIEISDAGKYLNKVSKNDEKIDIDKINEIKKRIENGTYKVDSKDLATKILEKMKGEI